MPNVRSLVVVVALAAHEAAGQPAPRVATAGRAGSTIRGTIRDSLRGGAPLAGAEVVLDGHDATTTTDWRGRFTLTDVPAGRYRATFYHPALDSMGLSGPVRTVEVGNGQDVDLPLHVPGAATLYAAACGAAPDAGLGVLTGTVVRAHDGSPHPRAVVRMRWRRLVLGDGVRSEPVDVTSRTDAFGRYRLCHVPVDAPVRFAVSGDDGAVHAQELVVGGVAFAVHPPVALAMPTPDATPTLAVRVHNAQGAPVRGAQVLAGRLAPVLTDADGRALIIGVATGDVPLEVRALGHRPVLATVTASVGARVPVSITLGASIVTLATSTVRATRDPSGFALRSASGSGGTFLNEQQIADRRASKLSDLLLGIPGVDVQPHGRSNVITMGRAVGSRGAFSSRCYPVWYIDGVLFFDPTRFLQTNDSLGSQERDGLRPDMLDQVAGPADLAGIEVYKSVASAPPMFATIGSECGVILVWTRRGQAARP